MIVNIARVTPPPARPATGATTAAQPTASITPVAARGRDHATPLTRAASGVERRHSWPVRTRRSPQQRLPATISQPSGLDSFASTT